MYGTSSHDRLIGKTRPEAIYGLSGNDWLSGRGGNDTLYGGAGNDTFEGGVGKDVYHLLDSGYDDAETILFNFAEAAHLGADTAYGFGKNDIIDVRNLALARIDTVHIQDVTQSGSQFTLINFFRGSLAFASLRLDGFDSCLRSGDSVSLRIGTSTDQQVQQWISQTLLGPSPRG